jgi:hypothetical protein
MREAQRYGIFQVGQVWRLVGLDGLALGFPDRERALAEGRRLLRERSACGDTCEVVMLDEAGRLAPIRREGPPGRAEVLSVG